MVRGGEDSTDIEDFSLEWETACQMGKSDCPLFLLVAIVRYRITLPCPLTSEAALFGFPRVSYRERCAE